MGAYRGVSTWVCARSRAAARAAPKSMNTGSPFAARITMFAGVMSRCTVAVSVHMLQPVEQPVQPLPPLGDRQRRAGSQDGVQRLVLDVLHHDAGRAERLDVAMNPHHVRMPEPMDRPRLVQETVETPG